MSDSDYTRQHGDKRACQMCAVAKTKCIFAEDSILAENKCERCARLKKPCVPQAEGPQKKKPPKKPAARDVEPQQRHMATSAAMPYPYADYAARPRMDAQIQQANNPLPHIWVGSKDDDDISHNKSYTWASQDKGARQTDTGDPDAVFIEKPLPSVTLTFDEMEELVNSWRPQMALHFPFAALYDGQSTKWLMVEKPYLSTAMATAALYNDLDRQFELAQSFMSDMSRAMMLRGEKSLDLLQGILVMLSWFHYHVARSPQSSNLLHLASALLVDLGLNLPDDSFIPEVTNKFLIRWVYGSEAFNTLRTMEERRILLGAYYLSNIFWCGYRKLDPIRWSPQIERACRVLEETQELPSDRLLTRLVRGQRIVEKIEHDLEAGAFLTGPDIHPGTLLVQGFSEELREAREDIPKDLENSAQALLYMTYSKAEASLFEAAYRRLAAAEAGSSPAPGASSASQPSLQRLDYVHSCVRACTDFINFFLSIPPADLYFHAFDVWAHVAHTCLILTRISHAPECWSLSAGMLAILDYEGLLERLAQQLDSAEATVRFKGQPLAKNHMFGRWAWRMRTFKGVNRQEFLPEHYLKAHPLAPFPVHDPVMREEEIRAVRASDARQVRRAQMLQDGMDLDHVCPDSWDGNTQCPTS